MKAEYILGRISDLMGKDISKGTSFVGDSYYIDVALKVEDELERIDREFISSLKESSLKDLSAGADESGEGAGAGIKYPTNLSSYKLLSSHILKDGVDKGVLVSDEHRHFVGKGIKGLSKEKLSSSDRVTQYLSPLWITKLWDYILDKKTGHLDFGRLAGKKIVICTSRQVSKTHGLWTLNQALAMDTPDSSVLVGFENMSYFQRVFDSKIRQFLPATQWTKKEKKKVSGGDKFFDIDKNLGRIFLPNLSSINFIGLETQRLRGYTNLKLATLDEVAFLGDIGDTLAELTPTMNSVNGGLIFCSTMHPGWFQGMHTVARQKIAEGNPDWILLNYNLFESGMYPRRRAEEILVSQFEIYEAAGMKQDGIIEKLAQEYFCYCPETEIPNCYPSYIQFNKSPRKFIIENFSEKVSIADRSQWEIFVSVDYGGNTDPQAAVWGGLNKYGQMVIFEEACLVTGVKEFVDIIFEKNLKWGVSPSAYLIDNHASSKSIVAEKNRSITYQGIYNQYGAKYGFEFMTPGTKERREKRAEYINEVLLREAQAPDLKGEENEGYLLYFGDVPETIQTVQKVTHGKGAPAKQEDHLSDALQYLVTYLKGYYPNLLSKRYAEAMAGKQGGIQQGGIQQGETVMGSVRF